MNPRVLVIDLISSGIKASVFESGGTLLGESYRPLPLLLEGNRAEQSPEAWTDGMKAVVAELKQRLDLTGLAAITFSAMSQVCLCLDEGGNPLMNAMTWSDSRASEDGPTPKGIRPGTGVEPVPNVSVRKLGWLRRHRPDIYEKTHKMVQCKDYLALKLTGVCRTDYSDGATTGAQDMTTLRWSRKALDYFGVSEEKMPLAVASETVIGGVTAAAAETFGIPEGTPVVMGAGDNLCSAVGAGCVENGDMYMSLGSSSWVARCIDSPSQDPRRMFAVLPHAVTGKYLAFVNYQTAGAVFKWLKNEIFRYNPEGRAPVEPYKNVYPYNGMADQASRSPLGANGLLFLPHILPGDASWLRQADRGAFLGLRWHHTREDMLRSALEGVCFELRRFAEEISGGALPERITVTGIASHESFWLQLLADVLGTEIQNTNLHDTPDSIGGAIVALKALGIYPDFRQADRFRRVETRFLPNEENHRLYNRIYERWLRADEKAAEIEF